MSTTPYNSRSSGLRIVSESLTRRARLCRLHPLDCSKADLGPVRYLATLLGSTDEQTMRWFILVVALLLDPAAVLLLLPATARAHSGQIVHRWGCESQ
jgi:hypothetical protein